jgi:hypothetical protein
MITECNIVRGLLRESFSPTMLNQTNAGKNVLLLFSFMDALWINDFSLNMTDKGYAVLWDDHESWVNDRKSFLENIVETCGTIMFIITKQSIKQSWLKDEYKYLQSISHTGTHKIVSIQADDVRIPADLGNAFDLRDQFSNEYYRTIEKLTEYMND